MCGIFGIVSNENVAPKITIGLHGLQHRGEQGAGIAVSDGVELHKPYRGTGLVTEVFNERNREEFFKKLLGRYGIGHTLYSTVGKTGKEKQPKTFQPLIGEFHGQPFALAHNGNLVRLEGLRKEAEAKGYTFHSEVSDTEVIVALLATSPEKDFLEALQKVLPRLEGAFALTILFKDKVIGVRDRYGIRPLCLGRDTTSFILASEESALNTLGASLVRESQPGELIVLGKNGIEDALVWAENPRLRICIFEFIYFARPDSRLAGQRVNSYREKAGWEVATEHPVKADMVCAVPESGEIYNHSIARVLKIPVRKGILRSRYFTTRAFMAAREVDRRALVRKKLFILREVVHGQRVVITEDSIVRGDTSPEVVAMLREAGAAEVHELVGSAPLRWPCFLGIDLATRVELVAAGLTEEEVGRKVVHADSLGYLNLEGMIKASGLPRENLCLGCFIGPEEYPIEPPPEILNS
ncbi:MAG: amidophosphoribosyltransferase [Candidatus Nealsonbacteria bacterium CG_4_10_14_0_2_um_filter_40_15]|uniref:Amidophosphoribosyltransferase n=1 Tax=Candidatus Nealsonbacteria bacterium CG_4_10_14_0_2_um_filter_40_15 TaxID=1974682 RepID=A0A2M7UU41_9BACT|nr:MAG: amidophosphoribosyltransferase [Candidatus Nealsonbacteria bacterium CG_4_10_14_0_2_um_filter_40_15]